MNVLGLVFSLLLILSYGFFVTWDKSYGSRRLRNTYLGHEIVNRKILLEYEKKLYEDLRYKRPVTESGKPSEEDEEVDEDGVPTGKAKHVGLNPECARLNLMPLIQNGRDEQPALYDLALNMLRIFYRETLFENKAIEKQFLAQLLDAAKGALQKEPPYALEKLSFKDPKFQALYYKMLKGTKEWDLPAAIGYPTILDYIKFEGATEKICLFHAHPDMITLFFGPKAAKKLYEEMHKSHAEPITQEAIEQICIESHIIRINPDLFELLVLGRPNHERESKVTLVEKDEISHISLRKTIYLNPNQEPSG
jgi:hypothetical protein